MPHRIEVGSLVPDTRATVRLKQLRQLSFGDKITGVNLIDVYTTDKNFSQEDLRKIGGALTNPVTQGFSVDQAYSIPVFNWAVEVGFLPGVTDNVGNTAKEIAQDLLSVKFEGQEAFYTSQVTFIKGDLTREQVREIGESMANKLIQRIHIKSADEFKNGMDTIVPRVELHHEPHVDDVNLDLPDEELAKLGKQGVPNADGTRRGPLALGLDYLHAIRDYFAKEGRKPTDIEVESK